MLNQGQPQKKTKKPPACDSCKASRVLCHPQPANAPCPRCVVKNIICTTTPVARGRPRKVRPPPQSAPSTSFPVSSQNSSIAVVTITRDPRLDTDGGDCPSLDPEFVAHCFECFEFIPHVHHPVIKNTDIKAVASAAAFQLHLLSPQRRVLTLCIIAVASLMSFHEYVLGAGPRPQSLENQVFFSSNPDLRAFGVRRGAAHRALQIKALQAAWDLGIMLEPSEENAASCYLLNLLEQNDSCGLSRPWAGAYISHIRTLGPRWRTAKYAPSNEGRWSGFLMSEMLFATSRRMPMLITHHDQLLLSGPEPPALDAWLESLEASKKLGLQLLWASVKPYAFHATCLGRLLYETINGDYARLRALSEAAVIKFLSSLAHLHAACSLLLACANTTVSPATHKRKPIRWKDDPADSTARVCAHTLVVGFVSLALPFYRELELRGDDAEPRGRERMRLFRLQAREMVVLGVRELARTVGYLPMVYYTPMNWRIICSWAEFCLECPSESATDLRTCVNYLCSLYSRRLRRRN
ncbi:hypothetical protein B0H13DRAFT_2024956 [Mycena leptocephala]|nr:hypothetical protein B0H13DRAFT_2024956 [Mycena leptocephala]